MAKTKTRGEGSTAIRAYFSKNPKATAQEVVDALKAEGVTVKIGLVYSVKALGKKKKKKKAGKSNAAVRMEKAEVWAKSAGRMEKAVAWANGAASSTKADLIRETAKGMAKPVRPKDVVAALKERGVEVLHTHVSQVLASMGMKKKRKAAVGGAAPAVASNGLNINDLVMAKKLVGQVGSIEKVREALAALARLG